MMGLVGLGLLRLGLPGHACSTGPGSALTWLGLGQGRPDTGQVRTGLFGRGPWLERFGPLPGLVYPQFSCHGLVPAFLSQPSLSPTLPGRTLALACSGSGDWAYSPGDGMLGTRLFLSLSLTSLSMVLDSPCWLLLAATVSMVVPGLLASNGRSYG